MSATTLPNQTPPATSVEQALAGFVASARFDAIPPAVVHQAKRSLVNILATAFAGCREPAIDRMLAVQSRFSPGGSATLLGRPETTDLSLACLLNGMAANIHDFDDTHPPTIIHPSAPVAPAVIALAQERPMAGAELLRAFAVGAEITCRIGNAVMPSHYSRGWHITSTCGVFGSATATAAVLGLGPRQIVDALANAAAQSAGMVQTLGTMSKSISVGGAARNGMLAALLAAEGVSGPGDVLTGTRGFIPLHSDTPDPERAIAGLGTEWELARNTFKPYPVGVVLNAVIDAALRLRAEGLTDPGEIAGISIRANPLLRERTDRPDVDSGRLSQVSAQHAIAIVLLRGGAGLDEFDDAAVALTAGRRPRVTFEDEPGRDIYSIALEARLTDGTTRHVGIDAAKGSSDNPMTDDDLSAKFEALAARAGVRAPDRLLPRLWALEAEADAGALFRGCAAG